MVVESFKGSVLLVVEAAIEDSVVELVICFVIEIVVLGIGVNVEKRGAIEKILQVTAL